MTSKTMLNESGNPGVTGIMGFWERLGKSARIGLLAGLAIIVLATAFASWWLLKTDFQVLFSELKPQDAAVMTAELDKLKIPYKLDDGGAVILVDKAQVHATRIKVMGKDLPLHGAVGFELFNNSDFGMTEFAQKINYQRALQGELTRTILSLSEIRDVRVHLALPEQGLFKQASAKPKAAITVTLREGQALRSEQVSGIQRLVAAATPGMTAQDVTVLDKQGVALSRLAEDSTDSSAAPGAGSGNARLELKRDTEAQLLRKATAVLDKAFGQGQALASIDVTLSMDQVRTTTEDVIPSASRTADSKGVVVKERESVRDANMAPLDALKSGNAGAGGSNQREVDYQVGRRVEQVVSLAGAVRRIQVVAVVRQDLDGIQEEKLRRLLAAAVGASVERGDTVVVQSLRVWSADPSTSPGIKNGETISETAALAQGGRASNPETDGSLPLYASVLAALALMIVTGALLLHSWRKRPGSRDKPSPTPLSDRERQALLSSVQKWLQQGPTSPGQAAEVGPRTAGS